jgi:hypothetical protein
MRLAGLNILVLLMFVFSGEIAGQMAGYNTKPGYDPTVHDVSVLQLIANPQLYDGKRVRFIGFLRLEFEGDAIYLHREDYQHEISQNALWVNLPFDMTKQEQQAVNMHYVICSGVFDASKRGHMGMFSGEINDITRLQSWDREAK